MTKKRAGLPPQWEEVFAGRSMRQIAAAAGIYADRVSRFVKGEGVEEGTAELIADALGIPVKKAWELRGEPINEPFTLPRKAQRLTRSQRDAILRVIDGMLEGRDDKPAGPPAGTGLFLVNAADTLAAHKGRTQADIEDEAADRWDGIDPPGPDEGV
ncbi:hypothetical protein [Rhodococcus pyridinivorans]|uniref:Uncharacterized protein n=1 Tax=Rhodococcus pyridinivorans TaxID=103816 RepID=A0A7M2XJM4_9NOCA|nr:hypothetical protein [Rhodococcus pyridinivorans]QOV97201.1 hypothetical protein INP59_14590 [Rhodococcus pyridinivorans]